MSLPDNIVLYTVVVLFTSKAISLIVLLISIPDIDTSNNRILREERKIQENQEINALEFRGQLTEILTILRNK